MKIILALLTVFGVQTVLAQDQTLTCEWQLEMRGCTAYPRLKAIKVKVTGGKFTYLMNRDACYYQMIHEYTGTAIQQSYGDVSLTLQSHARRDVQLGEGEWKKDKTRFNLRVNLGTMEGLLNGRLPVKCSVSR